MRPDDINLSLRGRLVARDIAIRFPRLYTKYQLGHYEVIRRRLHPSYEREIRALSRWTGLSSTITEIVDVGANFGQSSWAFARYFPAARIHAFEANPMVAEKCRALLVKIRAHVQTLSIGPTTQSISLFIPHYRSIPFPGLATTDEASLHAWFNSQVMRGFREELLFASEVAVPQDRLDSLGLKPDLVKIDVEGAEIGVISGAHSTIESHSPTLLIECNGTFAAVERLLRPLGYRAFELRSRRWRSSAGMNLNQLFVHRTRLPLSDPSQGERL